MKKTILLILCLSMIVSGYAFSYSVSYGNSSNMLNYTSSVNETHYFEVISMDQYCEQIAPLMNATEYTWINYTFNNDTNETTSEVIYNYECTQQMYLNYVQEEYLLFGNGTENNILEEDVFESFENVQILKNANISGTLYYTALQSNSPHVLLDDEVGYTRICVKATDGTILMKVVEFNNATQQYEEVYRENQDACNKQILKESYSKKEYRLVENIPTEVEVITQVVENVWTGEESQQEIEQKVTIPAFTPGSFYNVGDVVLYEGIAYQVIQSHRAQSTWTPPTVPALFTVLLEPNEDGATPWVQPLGSEDCYELGATVTHNGLTWESTVACNVWEPGVFGWIQI